MQSQLVVLASPAEPWFDTLLRAHTGRIVAGLCVYAAIRILILAAAFPLFNITDEDSHFLTIRMFADGHLPGRELPPVDPVFEATYVLYGSPEYTHSQADLDQNGPRIPLYQLPPQARDAALGQTFYAQKFKDWSRKPNFEAQSPPLYYIVAAGWYDLGAALRIRDWGLLYWVRFLNPIAYALLVWLSYKFVRKVYPERAFLCLAVPALIAVYPQDIFFGMNRDVLSAPLAAAALLLMMEAIKSTPGKTSYLLSASLLVGLTFLVEVSNCVLYGALAATFWFWLRRPGRRQPLKIWVVSASALAAFVPPSLWILRNYLVMGDLTGSRAKMHELGWTTKPLADIFHHPLFSWDGLSYFLLQLTRTFWHGEYLWHGHW
ncbi:MAG: glycosyltransferase family 39 protein, partial [Terriglobales bacterium]